MESPLLLLLIIFVVIFVARPVSEWLRIPVLSLYLIAGILIGPSCAGLLRNPLSLEYFYELGIILLMFSAGLELKLSILRRNRRSVGRTYLLTTLIPGIGGVLLGWWLNRLFMLGAGLFFPLFLVTVFASSSVEIMIPLFREFAGKMERSVKTFSSVLISATVLAEITALVWFSGIVTFRTAGSLLQVELFIIVAGLFFFVVIKGLPMIQERMASRLTKLSSVVEDQTRILIMLLVIVVAAGAALHIHPIVCGFLAGVSLANVHINRKVLHNINFITFSLFVPVVFIAIGAEINLNVFRENNYYLLPVILIAAMLFLRAVTTYLAARMVKVPIRFAVGFGFGNVAQVAGTLATAIVAKKMGFIPEAIFDSIVMLSIFLTFLGPVISRNFLFPGLRHREQKLLVSDEFSHTDIRSIPLLTPLSGIIQRVQDTDLSVYPVTDEDDRYLGVIHLDDVKDMIFSEELDHLVIAADLLDGEYPAICREMEIEETIPFFKQRGISALPVIEECGSDRFYTGMLLLRDILPSQL